MAYTLKTKITKLIHKKPRYKISRAHAQWRTCRYVIGHSNTQERTSIAFLYIQQQNAVNDDDEWMDDMIYKILFTQSSIFVVCDTNVTLRIAFVMHSPIQFINDNFNI